MREGGRREGKGREGMEEGKEENEGLQARTHSTQLHLLFKAVTDSSRAAMCVVEPDDRLEPGERDISRASRQQQLKVLRKNFTHEH